MTDESDHVVRGDIYERINQDPLLGSVRRLALMQVIYALERDLQAMLMKMHELSAQGLLRAEDAMLQGAMHGALSAAMGTVQELLHEPSDSRLEGRMGMVEWKCRECRFRLRQRLRDYDPPVKCVNCDAPLVEASPRLVFDDGSSIP